MIETRHATCQRHASDRHWPCAQTAGKQEAVEPRRWGLVLHGAAGHGVGEGRLVRRGLSGDALRGRDSPGPLGETP